MVTEVISEADGKSFWSFIFCLHLIFLQQKLLYAFAHCGIAH
jgi:hypothetical protein